MSKEVLAFLVDKCGAAVDVKQICASIWDDYNEKSENYCRKLLKCLYDTLDGLGHADVLSFRRGAYAVVPKKLQCDYYAMLRNGLAISHSGEYMSQYSWAEYTAGSFIRLP